MTNPDMKPRILPPGADRVACDGEGGALGHPRVWYTLNAQGRATCGYCGQVFERARGA